MRHRIVGAAALMLWIVSAGATYGAVRIGIRGGKADLAQAGGRNESLLPGALKEAEAAVRETLAGGEAATGS